MSVTTAASEAALQERVRRAVAGRVPLRIVAGGTKDFLGRTPSGERFDMAGHRGIVSYEPTELVVTVRAGTRLEELEAALAEREQMLAFEPPHFGVAATVGGTVACGLSGPRRPFAGSARDFVLGVKLINGRAEVLRFGGTVIKNVAGFDVSRLMAGSFGTLGVLLEVALKVLPRPRREATLSFDLGPDAALERMLSWAAGPWPISALAYDGRLRVRLSGDEAAVRAARHHLGGEPAASADAYWRELREQRLDFFDGAGELWRFSVAPASPVPAIPGDWLYDWGGGQRWLRTAAPQDAVFAAAAGLGGHATLFRTRRGGERFQPLSPGLHALNRTIKQAFDPHRVFNRGRMYEDL